MNISKFNLENKNEILILDATSINFEKECKWKMKLMLNENCSIQKKKKHILYNSMHEISIMSKVTDTENRLVKVRLAKVWWGEKKGIGKWPLMGMRW